MLNFPSRDEEEYEYARTDPNKSAARHDEIISLRMLLLDLRDALVLNQTNIRPLVAKIDNTAVTWGKPGDCV